MQISRHCRNIISFGLAFLLLLGGLAYHSVSVYADTGIDTQEKLQAAIDVATGTKETPTVIEITSDFTVGASLVGIVINGKHVLIRSAGSSRHTLTRDSSFVDNLQYAMFLVRNGGSLVLENIVIDGGNLSNDLGHGLYISQRGAQTEATIKSGVLFTNHYYLAIYADGDLNMEGGEISGNHGRAITIPLTATVTISGGVISDCTDSAITPSQSSLCVSGSPKIGTGNSDCGVALKDGETISITGDLMTGSRINISEIEGTPASGTVVATKSSGTVSNLEALYFHYKPGDLYVVPDFGNNRYILRGKPTEQRTHSAKQYNANCVCIKNHIF